MSICSNTDVEPVKCFVKMTKDPNFELFLGRKMDSDAFILLISESTCKPNEHLKQVWWKFRENVLTK